MKIPTETKIRLGYGAAFLLLLIAFSYSIFFTDQLLQHIRQVNNSNTVLHNLETLMLETKDLDAFLLNKTRDTMTDAQSYYQEHFNSIDSVCTILQKNIHGDFIAVRWVKDIKNNFQELRDHIFSEINNPNKKEDTLIQRGHTLLQETENKITDMHTVGNALLALRTKWLNKTTGSMNWINIIILIIASLLAIYSLICYHRENKAKAKANMQIKAYAQELENKVAEIAKANNELIQLGSLQKFMVTGRIARMIGHEIRNPLTNIYLSYDQLKEKLKNNEHAVLLLDTIGRNSNRVDQLMTDLLHATRIQELKFKAVSINTVLDETLEIARDRIALQHIQVIKEYDSRICDVYVDVDRIKIAFLNIIINAVEAMPPDAGILTLRTETKNDKCIVQISDNGAGMDPETLEKIFDPYYTAKPDGNGLGLTNTQNIIVSHQGTIEVASEVGKGTTFTIGLDFYKGNE